MQPLPKKARNPSRRRGLLLLFLLIACAAGLLFFLLRPEPMPDPDSLTDPFTYGELVVRSEEEVAAVAVQFPDGRSWCIRREADGSFRPDGADWAVAPNALESLLRVAAAITYEDIAAEKASDYLDRTEEFGLAAPTMVTITYTDGTAYTQRIGDDLALTDEQLTYMTLDGDERLFVIAKGTADALRPELSSLHPVTQPGIEKARIDRIRLTDGGHLTEWALQGLVTDEAAADAWQITAPFTYPADGTAMTNLRSNLASLRMGAYVCEASTEALPAYGLDAPQQSVEVRLAEALVNETDESGAATPVLRPEATVRLDLGSLKNEYVRYVAFDGAVYTCSVFSLEAVTGVTAMDTATRYAVTVPLSDLASLTVEQNGQTTVWELSPGEDETTVLRNGQAADYAAFEAAYVRLTTVTVSGTLPAGWSSDAAPHTRFTFRTWAGEVRELALVPFDALHDAVLLDGTALFYLINGGLTWAETENAAE